MMDYFYFNKSSKQMYNMDHLKTTNVITILYMNFVIVCRNFFKFCCLSNALVGLLFLI